MGKSLSEPGFPHRQWEYYYLPPTTWLCIHNVLALLLKTLQRLPWFSKIISKTLQPAYSSSASLPTYLTSHTPVAMNFWGYSSPPCFCFVGPCCPHTLSPPGSSITLLEAFLDLSTPTPSPHTHIRFSHVTLTTANHCSHRTVYNYLFIGPPIP